MKRIEQLPHVAFYCIFMLIQRLSIMQTVAPSKPVEAGERGLCTGLFGFGGVFKIIIFVMQFWFECCHLFRDVRDVSGTLKKMKQRN